MCSWTAGDSTPEVEILWLSTPHDAHLVRNSNMWRCYEAAIEAIQLTYDLVHLGLWEKTGKIWEQKHIVHVVYKWSPLLYQLKIGWYKFFKFVQEYCCSSRETYNHEKN